MDEKVKLYILIGLTASFFVVELVVGNMVKSLALVADSFHMLSDLLSLIIGAIALKVRLFSSNYLFNLF